MQSQIKECVITQISLLFGLYLLSVRCVIPSHPVQERNARCCARAGEYPGERGAGLVPPLQGEDHRRPPGAGPLRRTGGEGGSPSNRLPPVLKIVNLKLVTYQKGCCPYPDRSE